jgi:hypothetical protein
MPRLPFLISVLLLAASCARDDHRLASGQPEGRAAPAPSTSAALASDSCTTKRSQRDTVTTSRDYTVTILERSESTSCSEGSRSEFVAVVRTRAGEFVDSIAAYGSAVGVFENNDALKGDPLLSADQYGGGSGADDIRYWNLRTGQPAFDGESLVSFVANGAPRYVSLSGAYTADTIGVVEYGDGRAPTQRVVFRADSLSRGHGGVNFWVGNDSLDGPRGPNGTVIVGNCCSGASTDTVPVRGVTIRFRVSAMEGAIGDAYDLTAEIVDDRLIALPPKRVTAP